MVPVLVLRLVALWFILRGDFFYVLTLCYFVLVFFSPFSIVITSLGEERANLSAFRTFVRFVLVWICRFLFLLVSGKDCGLWLWHTLDFSLTFFMFFFFFFFFCLFLFCFCLFCPFYAPPPKKWWVIMLYPLKFWVSVRPSVSAPTIRLPATPPTVLGQSFSNFTGAFRMVWRYAYCFFRILKLFIITFFSFLA